MTSGAPQPLELTPEQRKRLGQVYRIILSWRRREGTDVEPCAPEPQMPEEEKETPAVGEASHA
jgi:hypothetical protein